MTGSGIGIQWQVTWDREVMNFSYVAEVIYADHEGRGSVIASQNDE